MPWLTRNSMETSPSNNIASTISSCPLSSRSTPVTNSHISLMQCTLSMAWFKCFKVAWKALFSLPLMFVSPFRQPQQSQTTLSSPHLVQQITLLTIWNRRLLHMSINEVYALFTDANPTIKIRKSKFAELRPKHVLLSSQLPRNVCLCKYHENIIMAVKCEQS